LLSARSALKLEMFCRCFSFVRDFLVFDNLPLIEAAEAGFLDSRDMDKHILAAVLRLDNGTWEASSVSGRACRTGS
jgi:hypothetical protein